MNLKVVNTLLAGALFAILGLAWMIRPDSRKAGWEFFPDMARSQAYLAWEENPHLPGGITFQNPQPGTRPWKPPSLTLPPKGRGNNPGAAERGAALFAQFCQTCHGSLGLGDGPAAQRGLPPPPALISEGTRKLTDVQILEILSKGRNNMASYASQIDAEDRMRILQHIRNLQAKAGGGKS